MMAGEQDTSKPTAEGGCATKMPTAKALRLVQSSHGCAMSDSVRLIVNADDFGWSRGITDGIVHGHRHGVITSTTLAANMPACEYAAAIAIQTPSLGVGVHLNACQGPALSKQGREVLADQNGVMNSSGDAIIKGCLLHGRRFLPAIEAEFAAQIERALSLGLKPTHMDSHRHVHGWPAVFRLVLGLCRRYDIPHVRRHAEHLAAGAFEPTSAKRRRLSCVLNWLGRGNARRGGDLVGTTGTLGVAHTGHIDVAYLLSAIDGLTAGATEIMVHPGYAEDVPHGQTRLRESRRAELDALCDERVKERIRLRGVQLIHYGQL